jgi:hypothetical protein
MGNYLSLQVHSVCLCNYLEEMGIDPTKLEAVITPLLRDGE